jgi:hypothetical protein
VSGGQHETMKNGSGMIDSNQDLKQKGRASEESKASSCLSTNNLTSCRSLFTNRSPFLFLGVDLEQIF